MSEPGTNQRPVYFYFDLRLTISIMFDFTAIQAGTSTSRVSFFFSGSCSKKQ